MTCSIVTNSSRLSSRDIPIVGTLIGLVAERRAKIRGNREAVVLVPTVRDERILKFEHQSKIETGVGKYLHCHRKTSPQIMPCRRPIPQRRG